MKNYYKILDVKSTASQEEIHARWIELMRRFHPDRGKGEAEEDQWIREINDAYGVLKHPSSRAQYDLSRVYYRKKRRLYIQRIATPPAIFAILGILSLIYLQWSRVGHPGKPPLPSLRASIQTNQTTQIDQTDQTNQIDLTNQIDETNQINEKNQIDQIAEIDQTDQTNQTTLLTAAKAETSIKTKTLLPPTKAPRKTSLRRKMNPLNQTNETDDHTNQTNQIDEIDQTDQTNQIDEIDEKNLIAALEMPTEPHPNQLNETNGINQTTQTNPLIVQLKAPLPITEEGVKQFLDHYKKQYLRQDINGFLSLFSPSALQNGRDGIDEIRKIYSDFFHRSHELRYHLEDTRIEIYQEVLISGLFYEHAAAVEARYQVDQTLSKNGEKKVWRGDIRWILVKENGALKVLYLDFKPEKSP